MNNYAPKSALWRPIVCIGLVLLLATGFVIETLRCHSLKTELAAQEEAFAELDRRYSSELLTLNSITLTRFYTLLDSGEDAIVCISRPNCGTCRTYEEELLAIYERLDMTEQILFLNVAELHQDQKAWLAFKARFEIGGTPSFIHIRDGALISSTGWTERDGISMEVVETWLQGQKTQ